MLTESFKPTRGGSKPPATASLQTSETIDKNNEIGRAHSTMSMRVSARRASTAVVAATAFRLMSKLLS